MKNNIDDVLDKMQKTTGGATEFKSTNAFKQEFFKRAENEVTDTPSSPSLKRRIYAYAASLVLISGLSAAILMMPENPPSPEVMSISPGALDIAMEKSPADTQVALTPPCPAPETATNATLSAKDNSICKEKLVSPSAPPPCTRMTGEDYPDRSNMMMPPKSEMKMFASCLPTPDNDAYRIPPPPRLEGFDTEEYKSFTENPFLAVANQPLSTFGADADTASYTNLRRMVMDENRLPPADAIRIEELLNYFHYNYPKPQNGEKFTVNFELGHCPWAAKHELLLIGVQAQDIDYANLPPSNLVMLIDNSGSMYQEMPLVIESMTTLADALRPQDKLSIVTYGGSVNTLLDSVSGSEKAHIKTVLAQLSSDGGTPGSAGIQSAYKLAHKNFIPAGNNRIVLITDGDFNMGVSSESALVEMVEKERKSAIYLTAIGVGFGNYKDNKLKMLANKGNGNYIYLDSMREARNALVNELSGKMFTIVKDVKFQLEFNPAQVYAYRLLGYEFRKLEDRDFNDDTKDSGEVGVGHQITALYELIMADADNSEKALAGNVDALKYQTTAQNTDSDILTFKLRYQLPEGNAPSQLMEFQLTGRNNAAPGENFVWASSLAEFGMLLRNSEHKGTADFTQLKRRAQSALGDDPNGNRAEFLKLITTARDLKTKN